MAIGKQIKHYREKLGWTLEKVSELSEVDVGTISALEVRDSSRSKYFQKIAKSLGLTLEQLADESTDYDIPAENKDSELGVVALVDVPKAIPLSVTVEEAVARISSHLEEVTGYDRPTVISLLATLANSPDMHAVVSAGLKALKPNMRDGPEKHNAPAPNIPAKAA